MSGPSSPRLGGFSGMLSSVSGMSRDELERIGQAIGQAILARRETSAPGSGSQQPDPSPSVDPYPSLVQRQSVETDTDVPDDFIPTHAELEEIERVVLDKHDSSMNSDEDMGEEEEVPSLVTRISNLEKTQADILTLLRSLNDRFNMVPESPLESAHRRVHFPTDGSVETRTPQAVAPVETSAELPKMANLLKDLKPPSFGGEEKERNKDAVNMFLHKWGDIHSLRRNPEIVRPIEASLSLTGKAYKWWMSLEERPSSWEDFDKIFRKEFLPVNELQRSWRSWDKCSMEGISLNQYISDYREIVLKLKGIDEFQILRGFMRGLHPDYEAYVEPKQPKDLAEALKFAQIYDDISRRSKGTFGKAKEKEPFALKKRKFFKAEKGGSETSESFRGQGGRWKKKPRPGKQKSQSKVGKKDQYEKARKENLCFNCFEPGHAKADCPKLKAGRSSSDAKKDAKPSRQVHTVQRLPLNAREFSEVVVSHMSDTHECCVTQAMWQPSVGPHDLVRLYGKIGGRRVSIMIDDGATHNFLNYALVKRLKLPQSNSDHEYVVHLANGQDSHVWDTIVKGVKLKMQDYEASLDFQVMHLARADIYLGREWLYNLGPSLSRSYQDNSLEFTHEGQRVRL